eukprot:jgi/Chrzof1/7136/Cz02g12130.t1
MLRSSSMHGSYIPLWYGNHECRQGGCISLHATLPFASTVVRLHNPSFRLSASLHYAFKVHAWPPMHPPH